MEEYEKEVWKDLDVEGCGYKYSISSYGRVYNKLDNVYVSQVMTGKPQYFYVNLRPVGEDGYKGKVILRRVHNILGKVFLIKENDSYDRVDHIDQNRFNNSLDNLRWTDRKGNARNMESNIKFKCGGLLKDYCEKFKLPFHTCWDLIRKNEDISTLSWDNFISKYCLANCGELGLAMSKFNFQEIINIKPEDLNLLLSSGYSYQQIYDKGYKYGVPDKDYLRSVEDQNMWYPSANIFCEVNKISREVYNSRLKSGYTLDNITELKGHIKATHLYKGEYLTWEELEKISPISLDTIKSRVFDKGWTLEYAVDTPLLRVNSYIVNGEKMTKKAFIESFNLDARKVNKSHSKYKDKSLTELLESIYNIDLTDYEVLPFMK